MVICNCIQTDFAINLGILWTIAKIGCTVVRVTTAIVTTSGSSAGMGFAIPSDTVSPAVLAMIRRHVAQQTSALSGRRQTRLARSVHLETTFRLSQLGGGRVSQLSCNSSWAPAFAH
jgi:S1-C subfamily serine protease